ncbi:hypothetical protein D7V20_03260 [Acinetobacter rongchengensis]|uniref:Uncharacterized protein n=1 Tax=Acinetobacter rongchengensis TaxID=2419601 RepID=A0A3A8FH76_9GAMM|nr:hypothetical protein D7V20_03260 [Acinetobacter rongchengensis]
MIELNTFIILNNEKELRVKNNWNIDFHFFNLQKIETTMTSIFKILMLFQHNNRFSIETD